MKTFTNFTLKLFMLLSFNFISLYLFSQTYDVTINVTGTLGAIENASISIDGYGTQLTNASGSATFLGMLWGNYNCTITKPGYVTDKGFIYVSYTGSYPKTLYKTGDTYQGGIIFYIDANGLNGLVCTDQDLNYWGTTTFSWGCEGTEITGADGIAIGTGFQNTLDIINECTSGSRAAYACDTLNWNGYSDWFLPSLDELNTMYTSGIGGFSAVKYWSSTEFSSFNAWNIDFSSGTQNSSDIKTLPYYVRAVRSFGPPTISNAGPDQLNLLTTNATLAANSPIYGTGQWSIYSGGIGSFANSNDPTTIFTGTMGHDYLLIWTTSTAEGSSQDTVRITFGAKLIGENYAGGIVFYVDGTGQAGLVVAPTDQSTGIQWYNGSNIETFANGTAINSGLANTNLIVSAQGSGSYAALICYDLKLNGYTDWYLPANEELNLLASLQNMGFGNFAYADYWGSTELGSTDAYYMNVVDSFLYVNSKSAIFRVRAIRQFTTSPQAPTATTLPTTNIEQTAATLYGTVNANELSTTITFEYGTTPLMGSSIAAVPSPIITSTNDSVSVYLTGLTPYTTYYYCLKTENTSGITYGDTLSFTTGTVVDIDGNIYSAVVIGTQEWMSENLKTTRYQNGDLIPNIIDGPSWSYQGSGARAYYNNDSAMYVNPYGALYNWYTTTDYRKVCPIGWHVPTNTEWETLVTTLGGSSIAGSALKEVGVTHWSTPNSDATNTSGFTAVPGGMRSPDVGAYYNILDYGYWWTSSKFSYSNAWRVNMSYNNGIVYPFNESKNTGFSVRCIKGETYQLMFIVTNGQMGVNFASIQVDGLGVDTTNESGMVIFPVTPVGTYSYTITANGFYVSSGTVTITNENVNKNITLTHQPRSIYVSTTGDNEMGDGTIANPFQSIQRGIDEVVSNDTVRVLTGTYSYSGNTNISIFDKTLTLISSDGPGTAIIDGFNGASYDNIFNVSCGICTTYHKVGIIGFRIENSSMAVQVSAGASDVYIAENWISHSTYGLVISSGNTVIIERNLIKRTNNAAISLQGADSAFVFKNTIDSAYFGIDLSVGNYAKIFNNIISNPDFVGINLSDLTNPEVDYNNIWNWGTDSMLYLPVLNNIFVDPLYNDPLTENYGLQTGSPCIDSGDPDPKYNDPDGTRGDMGAFYYPQTFTVTFHTTDQSNNPLNGALVDFGIFGQQTTDASGDAIFTNATLGNFPYLVTMPDYYNSGTSINVTGNQTENVTLTHINLVTFNVNDINGSLQNAEVTFDSFGIKLTNVDGNAFFDSIPNGTYPYNVTKAGYLTSSGTVTVANEDSLETVFLTSLYNVTFNVDMTDVPVFDALNDTLYITGSMTGWTMPGLNLNDSLSRVGLTNTWTKTMLLTAGEIQYKYFRNYGWMQGEWGSGDNRIVNITKDTVINDVWSKYWINSIAGANGSISPEGINYVVSNTDQTYDIVANPHYQVVDVIIDGASQGPVNSYTFTNVIGNHNISAFFDLAPTNVTFNVYDELSAPIQNAQVTFYGETLYTNVSGQVVFNNIPDGTYQYTIDFTDYVTIQNSVTVSGSDEIVNNNMNPIVHPTGVTVSPSSLSLTIGNSYALAATFTPVNTTNQSITWSSSNVAVATVDPTSGAVTPVGPGTTTVTATTVDGGFTSTSTVTVTTTTPLTSPDWSRLITFGGSGAQGAIGSVHKDANGVYLATTITGSLNIDGSSFTSVGSKDLLLAKFSLMGELLGANQFNAQVNGYIIPTVIKTDIANNIYVAGNFLGNVTIGSSTVIATEQDAFIAMFDANGNGLWIEAYSTISNDDITDMVVDNSSNLYVIANTSNLIKYDNSANILWEHSYGSGILRTIEIHETSLYIGGALPYGSTTFGTITLNSGTSNNTGFIVKSNLDGVYYDSFVEGGLPLSSKAGNYQAVGYFQHPTSPRAINLVKAVYGIDEDTLVTLPGDLTSGTLRITVNVDNSISYIGSIVSGMVIEAIPDSVNYYDPIEHKFYLNYWYNTTAPRLISEVLTLVNEPAGNGTSIADITFDNTGNLLITGGFSKDLSLNTISLKNEIINNFTYIAKGDTSFNFFWANPSTPLSSNLFSYHIYSDVSGNIYEVGNTSINASFNYGAITVPFVAGSSFLVVFDINGNPINGYAISSPSRNGVTITTDGKIIHTGSNTNNGSIGYGNLFLTQYNNTMGVEWNQISTGAKSGTAKTNFLKIDNIGNMFTHSTIMGYCNYFGNELNTDISIQVLSKTDLAGNLVWFKQIADGTSGYTGQGTRLALDLNNNVAIGGTFSTNLNAGSVVKVNSDSYPDGYVIKYNSNGGILWSTQLFVNMEGSKADIQNLHFDNAGNLMVSGIFSGTLQICGNTLVSYGPDDVFIAKFDSNGNVLWTKVIGGSEIDYIALIATDAANNIYLTSEFHSNPTDFGDYSLPINLGDGSTVLAKLDPNGNTLWAYTYGGVEGVDPYGWAVDLRTDAIGNSYLWGWSLNNSKFGPYKLINPFNVPATANSYYLTKINGNGDVVWAKGIYEQQYDFNYGDALDIDNLGNVYIGGHLKDTISIEGNLYYNQGLEDMFIAKYDNNGIFKWFTSVPNLYSTYRPLNVIDAFSNDVIFAAGGNNTELNFGSHQMLPTNQNAFIATMGTVVTKPVTTLTINPTVLSLVVGDVGASITATISPVDASNQAVNWTTSDSTIAVVSKTGMVTPVGAGTAIITATAVDGGFSATCNVDVSAPVITPSDDWTRLLSFGGSGVQAGGKVFTDESGVYLAGNLKGSLTFEGTDYSSVGSNDLLLAKFNNSGGLIWANQYNAQVNGYINSIIVKSDPSYNIYVAGSFIGSVTIGSSTITSTTNQDAFIAKFDPSGNGLWAVSYSTAEADYMNDIAIDNISSDIFAIANTSKLIKYDNLGSYLGEQSFTTGTLLTLEIHNTTLYVGGKIPYGITNFDALTLTSGPAKNTGFIAKADLNGNFFDSFVEGGPALSTREGNYQATGTFIHPTAGPRIINLEKYLTGITEDKLSTYVGDLTTYPGSLIIIINGDNSISYDPSSIVAGYPVTAIPDSVNYYDPIEHKFYLNYQYNTTPRLITEVLTAIPNTSGVGNGTSITDISFINNEFLAITGGSTNNLTLDTVSLTNINPATYIAKCDTNFNFIWAKQSSKLNPVSLTDFSIFNDLSGNIYQTGIVSNTLPLTFGSVTVPNVVGSSFLFKFDPNGDAFNGISINSNSKNGTTISDAGNIVRSGAINIGTSPGYGNLFIEQVNTDMLVDWHKESSNSKSGTAQTNFIKFDAEGNMYSHSTFNGYMNYFGNELQADNNTQILAKHDVGGNLIWMQQINDGSGYFQSQGSQLALDKDNNIAIGGMFGSNFSAGSIVYNNTDGYVDGYVIKYGPNGFIKWSVRFLANSVGSRIDIDNVHFDLEGNLIVSGSYTGTIQIGSITLNQFGGGGDNFLAKFDPNGNNLWANAYGGAGMEYMGLVSTDAANNIYFSGEFHSNPSNIGNISIPQTTDDGSTLLAKIDPNGTTLWAKFYGGVTGALASDSWPVDIRTDAVGNSYLWGACPDNSKFDAITLTNPLAAPSSQWNFYLSKINTSGDVIWAKAIYQKQYGFNYGDCLDMDKLGNLYVGGHAYDTISIEGTEYIKQGIRDIILAKYDSSGAFQWFKNVPMMYNSSSPALNVVAALENDVVFIGGGNSTKIDFGTFQFAPSNQNAFIATKGNFIPNYSAIFTVDDGTVPLESALVSFASFGDQNTDISGIATYNNIVNGTYSYTVTLAGYQPASGTVSVSGENLSKIVTLTAIPDVTFSVTGNALPIDNAEVVVDGIGTFYTDIAGLVTIPDVLDGTYTYTVNATGFQSSTGSITVSLVDLTENVVMTPLTYNVTINVYDDMLMPLDGAEVGVVSVDTLITSAGTVTFSNLVDGIYTYTIKMSGFADSTGTFEITGGDVIKDIYLLRNVWNFTFQVYDEFAMPLAGAQVILTGLDTLYTDGSGLATFTGLFDATYPYVVSMATYQDSIGSVTLTGGDWFEYIYMKPILTGHSITFQVFDGATPLPNAEVFVSPFGPMITDLSGTALFNNVPDGIYPYSVTLSGYTIYNGNITVAGGDLIETVFLTPDGSSQLVTFSIYDGGTPISGAEVSMDTYGVQFSNIGGVAVYSGVTDGTYNYTVTVAGYQLYTGTITVLGAQVSELVLLSKITYNLMFSVYDGATPVEGAEVSVDGYGIMSTDIGGMVTFIVPNGTYNYYVNKYGYEMSTGSITIADANNGAMVNLTIMHLEQMISLKEGWNIFSSNLIPDDADMSVILANIISAGKVVKVQDQTGNALEYIDPTWVNGIGNLTIEQGYKIKVTEDLSFMIFGTLPPQAGTIPYISGWNITGFPSHHTINAKEAMQSLIDEGSLQKVQSQTGAALEILPVLGWINNIGNFVPTEGYKVRVSAPTMLSYGNTKSSYTWLYTESYKGVFTPSWVGNGLDHMNIYLRNASFEGKKLNAGDEIGIFDDNTCVGTYTVNGTENNLYKLKATLDDPYTIKLDGFTLGHQLSMKIWINTTAEFADKVDLAPIQGYNLTFEASGTTVLSLDAKKATTSVEPNENSFTSITSLYPNPFNDKVSINFYIAKPSKTRIEVFDLLGSKIVEIVNKDYLTGSYTIEWNRNSDSKGRVAPGVYIIKMQAGEIATSKRIIAE